jgi:hypothetical protein
MTAFNQTPDLVPADLYLFPRLTSALKGRHFYDATDIIRNATEELKWLSLNGFQECFQHLYSRWQKCIIAQGEMIVLFYFSEINLFRETFENAS